MYVAVHVCSGDHALVGICEWRPDLTCLCCSGSPNLALCVKIRRLIGLELRHLVSPASLCLVRFQMCRTCLSFFMWVLGVKLEPRVCMASPLLTDPASPSVVCLSGLSQSLCLNLASFPSYLVVLDEIILSCLAL